MGNLSHIDAGNRPTMVDVSGKTATAREAHAQSRVRLPDAIVEEIGGAGDDITTRKGPVFATAIIAGVMAAKKTHELIPFCPPVGLDDCHIEIRLEANEVIIDCRCKVVHRTGVEMEALTGASVAALTVYDMLKAMSHDIAITATRLMAKTGGKRDFHRDA